MSNISKPNTFSASTPISSSQVNANFDTIYNDYNGGISEANLADDAVTTDKVADDAITGAKIADATVTPANLTNPYKFSVYRNAAQNTGNGAFSIINFDTELFDTNNNFDVTTNVGRYTAPVDGFYHFDAQFASTSSGTSTVIISLYKNGSDFDRGTRNVATSGGLIISINYSNTIQLMAGDYVEMAAFGSSALAMEVGAATKSCKFSGFLVSQT